MLNNRILFEGRLMPLLRSIIPSFPLPVALEPYLWQNMEEEPILKYGKILEGWQEKHKKAYYVVTGFVIVFVFDVKGNRHSFRFYRRHTIVALDSFLNETASEYMIWRCPGVVLWSITRKHIQCIYDQMEGMELMVEKTVNKFHIANEQLRECFLMLHADLRVLKFYQEEEFKRLIPIRSSPILDQDIADHLAMSLPRFRRIRKRILEKGLL